jgi:RNA polymerase sigma-70 factor (ECF subfamily)
VTKSRKSRLVPEVEGGPAEDSELVRLAARGDRAALEQLLRRAQEAAFRFSFMSCGHTEDAEDVMQEALLKTYRYVGTIRDPEAFRTWLFKTVRNACLVKRRRRVDEPRHHQSIEQSTPSPDGRTTALDVADHAMRPDEAAINRWLGSRLRAALATLPPLYRVIVFLREMEGLSTREVASVLRISEDNVKTRLHRARTLLRAQLKDVSASAPARLRTSSVPDS